MIKAKQTLIGHISNKGSLKGNIGAGVIKEYPELEDLVVTPSNEEQKFKSSKYGYDEVTVHKVEAETLEITPSMEKQNYKGLFEEVNVAEIETEEATIIPTTEKQIKEGLFNKVTVEKITGDSLDVTPAVDEQNFTGVYTDVKVNPIVGDNLEVTPGLDEQNFRGVYTDVKVSPVNKNEITITPGTVDKIEEGIITKVTVKGDEDFKPENIVKDKEIFGLKGTHEDLNTSDATATALDMIKNKTAYVNGVKITGTIEKYDGAYTGSAILNSEMEG